MLNPVTVVVICVTVVIVVETICNAVVEIHERGGGR
jgi:hypothetical protein